MGYDLKRVLKSKPVKKIKEVDEIFENVWKANRESDENPESLRISVDAKAKVNIGEFSRNGKSRDRVTKKAGDHDMNPEMKLVPYGILDVLSGMLSIFFGTSFETSDFIVDCLEMWWEKNRIAYPHIKELVINLDNSPNSASGRTQFIRRMTEFSDKTGLQIRLVYYPPLNLIAFAILIYILLIQLSSYFKEGREIQKTGSFLPLITSILTLYDFISPNFVLMIISPAALRPSQLDVTLISLTSTSSVSLTPMEPANFR